jgi:hypothetical protein
VHGAAARRDLALLIGAASLRALLARAAAG